MCISSLVIIQALFRSRTARPPQTTARLLEQNDVLLSQLPTDHRPYRAARRGARPLSPRAPTTDAPIERPTARAKSRAFLADGVVVAPSS